MGRRLILDTNVVIDFERGLLERATFRDDSLAIAAISVAEYRIGIELADTAQRVAEREHAWNGVLSAVSVLQYGLPTARHHARLLAHTRRTGRARNPYDLIIAAHALETDRVVVSQDVAARFADLPGVSAISA